MPTITFNAFSFLQKKLKKRDIACSDARIEVPDGSSPADLIKSLGLSPEEVEVAMINGKVADLDAVISENDRVALLPHGTPGPYRVLLGFKSRSRN